MTGAMPDLATLPIPRDLRQAKALDLLTECRMEFVERLRDVLRHPLRRGVTITVERPAEVRVLQLLPRDVKERINPVMVGIGVQPVVTRESGWWLP